MRPLRTHLVEMNETQLARIAELLRADMLARPADYADAEFASSHNPLTYLADCCDDCIATRPSAYDPKRLNGFTL